MNILSILLLIIILVVILFFVFILKRNDTSFYPRQQKKASIEDWPNIVSLINDDLKALREKWYKSMVDYLSSHKELTSQKNIKIVNGKIGGKAEFAIKADQLLTVVSTIAEHAYVPKDQGRGFADLLFEKVCGNQIEYVLELFKTYSNKTGGEQLASYVFDVAEYMTNSEEGKLLGIYMAPSTPKYAWAIKASVANAFGDVDAYRKAIDRMTSVDLELSNKFHVDTQNEEMDNSPNKDASIRILAVDNEPAVLESFGMILKIKGYYVKLALQAEDALDLLGNERFDIIFSGLKMPPGMDGMEFLKIVKQKYPDTEFIMVTAYADEKTHAQAITLGALEYLRMPFIMEEIYELVERALKRIKSRKEQGNA